MNLASRHCAPCEGGMPSLGDKEINQYLKDIPAWDLINLPDKPMSIRREFKFNDFKESLDFVNKVGELAESEGHHPDMEIHYNKVDVISWTHAVRGLSDNDFILASKIDAMT